MNSWYNVTIDKEKIDAYNSHGANIPGFTHGANIPGFTHLTNFDKDREYIYEMTIKELTRNQDAFIIDKATNLHCWKGLYVKKGLGDLSWFWNIFDRIAKEMAI